MLSFFSALEPMVSFPNWEAATAVPPPTRRTRQRVEMTLA
jgi:hypothetical protein